MLCLYFRIHSCLWGRPSSFIEVILFFGLSSFVFNCSDSGFFFGGDSYISLVAWFLVGHFSVFYVLEGFLVRLSVTIRNHMLISLLSVSLFVYAFHLFLLPLNLLRLSTCSHDYSDTSVIVTQPDSINSYPG
jgi:hypothetical protein